MTKLTKGNFKNDLMRSFKEIKESRAISVAEDLEICYKRKIEDLCKKLRQCQRDREDMVLDLAPSNIGNNRVVPSDFNVDQFMEKDLKIGLTKRETEIHLEILLARYEQLVGPYPDKNTVLKVLPNYEFAEFEETAE